MKKRALLIGSAVAGAAGALTAGLGFYLSNRIMYMAIKEDTVILEREVSAKRLILKEYDSLPKEEIWIQSPQGYQIKTIIVHPHPSKRYVIFCHGVTENKVNSIKYMNLFLSKGFNAIIFDHRRHGESGGRTTSYGFYEKLDLKAVVDTLIQREGEDVIFGIHGESMGAATALLYAGSVEDRADFYIADCPFSDFREQLAFMIQKDREVVGSPRLAISLAAFFIRLRDGYSIHSVSPKEATASIKKPVLFIHSKNDGFIPSHMTEQLYEIKIGPKKLFIAENGDHAQSYVANEEEYSRCIDDFLAENGL
ncbi:alpha/beta hydrolase [Jeotgalibacillus proteolyticus]|uniref:alpha/beta hydrolase n=1 Tax=Jeotgalibacillus proteolyticus TaxID=2082395 RepID=UPI003CEDE59B